MAVLVLLHRRRRQRRSLLTELSEPRTLLRESLTLRRVVSVLRRLVRVVTFQEAPLEPSNVSHARDQPPAAHFNAPNRRHMRNLVVPYDLKLPVFADSRERIGLRPHSHLAETNDAQASPTSRQSTYNHHTDDHQELPSSPVSEHILYLEEGPLDSPSPPTVAADEIVRLRAEIQRLRGGQDSNRVLSRTGSNEAPPSYASNRSQA